MFEISFPVMMVWAIATVFVFAGLANLIGIRPVRRLYKRWDIPAATYRIIGVVELIAAAFLAQPDLRLWGIAIAAPIVFGAVILLLNHRHYAYATAVSDTRRVCPSDAGDSALARRPSLRSAVLKRLQA
jgi:hypothetical protein